MKGMGNFANLTLDVCKRERMNVCQADKGGLFQAIATIWKKDFIQAFLLVAKLRGDATNDIIAESGELFQEKNGAQFDLAVILWQSSQANVRCFHG